MVNYWLLDLSTVPYDYGTQRPVWGYVNHTDWVESVAFLPDGKQILSSSDDGTVRRWSIDDEASSGDLLHTQTSRIWCMCTSQTGRLLAFGDDDGCIRFEDISTCEMKELQIEPADCRLPDKARARPVSDMSG